MKLFPNHTVSYKIHIDWPAIEPVPTR